MQSTLILGAGPGGTGPLIWAAQQGRLREWLAHGVTILDVQPQMGGTIGRYIINSDSLGGVYLECLRPPHGQSAFAPLLADPVTRELERMRTEFPPLDLVGEHMRNLGRMLAHHVASSPGAHFRPGVRVERLRLRADRSIVAETVDAHGERKTVVARAAIMAVGGRQDRITALRAELLPGVRLDLTDIGKIILSDELFRPHGLSRALCLLGKAPRPRVVILGGSHSAFSSAWLLTRHLSDLFGPGSITILLRRPPRVFYGSREEAEADGMTVSERDICPATLRVNRLGGLRGDGRELWRRLTARPGSEPMNCVVMAPLDEWAESPVRSLLDDATLIVPAFGYRAATVPVYDVDGTRIRLSADLGQPAIGRDARVLTESGSAIDNLFGIGLGTGYRPWGHMGGEPAFDGQANSLWLYQNHIGEIVFRGVEEIRNSIDRAPRLASHRLVTGSDSSDRVRSVRLTRDGRPSRRDAFR